MRGISSTAKAMAPVRAISSTVRDRERSQGKPIRT